MSRPDPLTELYAVGYLVEAAAQSLDLDEAESLRHYVSDSLKEPLQAALEVALLRYGEMKNSATPIASLGMAASADDDTYSGAPPGGPDPVIKFQCKARCVVPNCGHEVVVYNAKFLNQCRCPTHPAKFLKLFWI